MDKKTTEVLNVPLEVHFKPGPGGRKYRFVEGKDVIARLNAAFDHDWSSRVIDSTKDSNQIIVLLELTAKGVSHQGYGGSEIAVYKNGDKQGTPVDISNSYKAAFTNALKKAAEQFGVGLTSDDKVAKSTSTTKYEDKKISDSTTISTKKNYSENSQPSPKPNQSNTVGGVDIKKIAARAVQEAQKRVSEAESKPTLASSYQKYNPEEVRVKEESNPFKPSGDEDSPINDIQINAIKGMLLMKKVMPETLISKALPESTKTKIEELTKKEAKIVIQAVNTLKSEG